ncbi:striatin-3-like isoform X2 [Centruroides sculpturatus]|uniref:striatin-3-like isoform X2 n=1 Tax=Centruroides sculpturatus TaxID=218467 RepID=UPI000C6E36A2|nr:striatin-3-like isoform X2 [Centruroides sculpturatus]
MAIPSFYSQLVNGEHEAMLMMMDECPNSVQNHTGPNSPPSLGPIKTSQDEIQQQQRPRYSIPGIVHFIQHEWTRFEAERAQWEVERAELQARIAFLQGERKGQENLKNDLIRRIKMLEYALKQERTKTYKLKYGADPNQADARLQIFDETDKEEPVDGDIFPSNSNVTWKQGRQLLRQYLQEIGYTDTIIDIRSARVRSLLGLNNNIGDQDKQLNVVMNGDQTTKRANDVHNRRIPGKKINSIAENTLMDAEASVLATFDFLASENVDVDDEDENLSDELEFGGLGVERMERSQEKRMKMNLKGDSGSGLIYDTVSNYNKKGVNNMMDEPDGDEVVSQFDYLGANNTDGAGEARSQDDTTEWNIQGRSFPFQPVSQQQILGNLRTDNDGMEPTLGLGDLAELTINNEAESTYDVSATKEAFRKTWNAKYTLRSHFDCVRALAFHPVEPVLISASEDHTLKLWNLQKTLPAKKTSSLDVEPVYTFRGHVGPVLCLVMGSTGEQCYSGGLDGTIRCWNIPNSNIDPYDSYDPGVLAATLCGHTDSVYGLSIHTSKVQLISCSSDSTIRLWSPQSKVPLLNTYVSKTDDGMPTSVDFVRCEPTQMVAAYTSSNTIIFDIETGKPIMHLESNLNADGNAINRQINKVITHPTLPITITAHEDRHICFFDNNTGKVIHSMVAHLDAVTSLAIDPNGLYLLSGSHDCSIRLWNMDNKTCVQEITSHRKKFDESIFDVSFHPCKPFIASAGADALAKVFV